MYLKVSLSGLLANVKSRSRSLYAVARQSVVCLSVYRLSITLVHLPSRLKLSAIFIRHLVPRRYQMP